MGLLAAVRSRPTAPPPKPPPDPYHQHDLEQLRDLRQWAGKGWEVAPRPTVEAQTIAPPAPAPAMTADRPQSITDMVGQDELRNMLAIVVEGSRARGVRMPHILLAGPAGFGKTTVAQIVAAEIGADFVQSTGIMLRKPHDLSGLLLRMEPNTVVFIDEIHAMAKPVMEALYEALEDGTLSVIAGHGSDAQAVVHTLPPFTCVGATTDPGRLSTPFRERFGVHGHVEPYTTDELAEIVRRAWDRREILPDAGEAYEVARRCKGVPRLALHLADRVLDYCAVHGIEPVPVGLVGEALAAFGVDENGLTSRDWRVLNALVNTFNGNPVGLDALACAVDIDPKTLSAEIEPPLAQAGLIQRTKGGRMALPPAHELYRATRKE